MIYGIFHQGSGLGNQLQRYVATRVLAEEKGYEWGMIAPENFKGTSFMTLDTGKPFTSSWTLGNGGEVIPNSGMERFAEKKVTENGTDIRGYDPEFNFIQDNTIIDGEFQDERYFSHMSRHMDEWLPVQPLGMPNELCVIGFRGGEFQHFPELYLTDDYWNQAIEEMVKINPRMKFIVVTDDMELARKVFPPQIPISHEIGLDWRMIRFARYLILANSSFYILPALLNENAKKIIAPRFWARRNTGQWSMSQNYYSKFHYI